MTTTYIHQSSEYRNFNNIEMRLLELELSWSFNPGTLKGETEADTAWIWAADTGGVMKKGGLWVWNWSTRSQLCVIVSSFSSLSAAFCIIVGQKFSGDCTVLIARSQLIYSSSKVTKKNFKYFEEVWSEWFLSPVKLLHCSVGKCWMQWKMTSTM